MNGNNGGNGDGTGRELPEGDGPGPRGAAGDICGAVCGCATVATGRTVDEMEAARAVVHMLVDDGYGRLDRARDEIRLFSSDAMQGDPETLITENIALACSDEISRVETFLLGMRFGLALNRPGRDLELPRG